MIARIDRLLEIWAKALMAVAIIAVGLMMVHVTVDIFFRTVMNQPLRQTNQTVAAYYMIAAAFLPIAWLGKHDDHISVDIFTEHLPPAIKRWLSLVPLLLGMAYMFVFTWQSWISAARRTDQGEVLEISGGYMPVWPGRWMLPLAGASLFLCLGLRLVRLILTGHEAAEEHHPPVTGA